MPRQRHAFTLLELLVVLALLAILSALTAAAFIKVRNAQQSTATDQLLVKINTALDRQWSAARDQADKEFKEGNLPGNNNIDTLIAFAGGDRDRARSLWVYLRLKNEFPQTFTESRNPTRLQFPSGTDIVNLPVKKTYNTAAITAATGGTAAQEAAVLLQIIVAEKAARGEAFGDESVGAGQTEVTIGTAKAKVFSDSWGTPIAYVRFATNAEIQSAPYSKSGVNKDTLDPSGRLNPANWAPAPQKQAAASWIFRGTATGVNAHPNLTWLPTAVSAGPDKEFNATTFTAAGNGLVDVAYNTDDLLGYRVKREGSQGE
jgi:prepilin-type N-terminal cleavage/methylation domain-containing protein